MTNDPMTNDLMTDDLTSRLVSLTRDLMLIPSSVTRPDDRERCYEFVRNHVESLAHIDLRSFRQQGVPSLLAVPEGVETPDVLLCGHLDVIDHPDAHSYRSRVTDARIHGPGAGDMKGALAIMLEVFRDIHGRFPEASLGLLVTADEETGGDAGVRYLFEDLGFRCGCVLIPDGGSLCEVTIEEKGALHLELECEGHETHAARPWTGDNPLDHLMQAIGSLKDHFDESTSDGDHWHPTCTVTVMRTPNQSVNRVPRSAMCSLDVRFPAPYKATEVLDGIRDVVGKQVHVRALLSADPIELEPDPLYEQVAESVIGQPVERVREHGASDARFVCSLGIPVVMSRPLVGELHSEDEWIDIASMITFYRVYHDYLLEKLDLTK